MGQGDPGGQHQAGVAIRPEGDIPSRPFRESVHTAESGAVSSFAKVIGMADDCVRRYERPELRRTASTVTRHGSAAGP
jgi:hypothetical protein